MVECMCFLNLRMDSQTLFSPPPMWLMRQAGRHDGGGGYPTPRSEPTPYAADQSAASASSSVGYEGGGAVPARVVIR
jgi:hypothetical protein